MESGNFPEKKYEDTMKSFISYQDVRKGNNDRKLSLIPSFDCVKKHSGPFHLMDSVP